MKIKGTYETKIDVDITMDELIRSLYKYFNLMEDFYIENETIYYEHEVYYGQHSDFVKKEISNKPEDIKLLEAIKYIETVKKNRDIF